MMVCLTLVVVYLWKNQENTQDFDDDFVRQSELYEQIKPKNITTFPNDDTSTEDNTIINNIDYLAECKNINPDTIAWLYIPNTSINFPIVQSQDNEYYLNHSLEKESSSYGVPFLDYRCSNDFSDFNSIIYGHNIKGEKMFAELLNFQNKDYFNTHTNGYLITSNGKFKINFIACLILKNDSFVYNTIFLTEEEKIVFLKDIKSQAVQYRDFPNVELSKINIVTLSTCSYEFKDARTLLIGVIND
ncbi:MAG: class B sortase [Oscillospiraceae bacterium]